jgi:DNA-binding beta-propeller fold protein YncE
MYSFEKAFLSILALLSSPHSFPHLFAVAAVGEVTTLTGTSGSGSVDGTLSSAKFNTPVGVSISADGSFALIGDQSNHRIRRITFSSSSVTTLAGSGTAGSTNGIGTGAFFNKPMGVSISPNGLFALVADNDNHLIRQIVIDSGAVTTLAGLALTPGSTDGIGSNARFFFCSGVAISTDGLFALVADTNNHLIRRIDITTASVTRLAGSSAAGVGDGSASVARFNFPTGVSISPDGSFALIADNTNHQIRRIAISTGAVTTLAGSGTGATGSTNGIGTGAFFNIPRGVSISPDGLFALVADSNNHLIRQSSSTAAMRPLWPVLLSHLARRMGSEIR